MCGGGRTTDTWPRALRRSLCGDITFFVRWSIKPLFVFNAWFLFLRRDAWFLQGFVGFESGEDGYILNVRFSASLQCSASMSQATDRNYINIEIRAWGGDNPGLMLHDIVPPLWGPIVGLSKGGPLKVHHQSKSQHTTEAFTSRLCTHGCERGVLKRLCLSQKGQVSCETRGCQHGGRTLAELSFS